MSTLVSGAAGVLARLLAKRLADEGEVAGIDVRPAPDDFFPGPFQRVKRYDHRHVADIFRRLRPRCFIHLGVRAASSRSLDQRYTQNVLGTRHLLELCLRYGTEQVVALSTYHVYGAHQYNPVHIKEDAPLRSAQVYPELVDVVELDHTVSGFLWRHRRVKTILLRVVNVVGPHLQNHMSRLLRRRYVPRLLGFNPMMQFLHEEDTARAFAVAARSGKWGIYNVAGEGAVPWGTAIRLAGSRPVPVPHPIAYPVAGLVAKWRRPFFFPHHLLDYFRYAVIVSDRAFREGFGFAPRISMVETLQDLR